MEPSTAISGSADSGSRQSEPATARTGGRFERTPREPPLLSVIVPTKNERENVAALLKRLEVVLPTLAMEVIFVDASTDGTPQVIEALGRESSREVVLLSQGPTPARRTRGGVVQGSRRSRPLGLRDGCRSAASARADRRARRAGRGQASISSCEPLLRAPPHERSGGPRHGLRSTTTAAGCFPTPPPRGDRSDGGFFLVRRDAVDLDALRPRGFKILLELLVRNPELRATEVSFTFGVRRAGRSKAGIDEGLRHLTLLARLRFARFGAVGASGLVVNTLLLAFLTDFVGLFYVVSAVIATQGSTLWNYCLTERWVFADRDHKRGAATRLALFFLMNNAALAVRGPLLSAHVGMGINTHLERLSLSRHARSSRSPTP